jgi:hypothetical protein
LVAWLCQCDVPSTGCVHVIRSTLFTRENIEPVLMMRGALGCVRH